MLKKSDSFIDLENEEADRIGEIDMRDIGGDDEEGPISPHLEEENSYLQIFQPIMMINSEDVSVHQENSLYDVMCLSHYGSLSLFHYENDSRK